MKMFLKSIICIVTAIVIFNFSMIQASAEVTFEQDLLTYCLKSRNFVQSIPYLPSWFQNLTNWSNCKDGWSEFVSNSVYDNRIYLTGVNSNKIVLYIYNYDEITSVSNSNVNFSNFAYCALTATFYSDIENYKVSISQGTSSSTGKVYSLADYDDKYVSISCSNQALFLDDTTLLYETLDEDKKKIGILDALKSLLTGKFSLFNVDASLIDKFDLLGDSFNGWLNDLLDINVDVSSDEYNTLLNDLEYNTQNSAYINNVSQDTLNQIRNTYNNMKSCIDNSLSVYNDDDDNYYYTSNSSNATYSTTNNTSTPNYTTYEGDTSEYFTTYIIDNTYSSNLGDDGGLSGSTGDGCGCTVNATANAEVNQGDINISVGFDSDNSGTSSNFENDIDISTFTSLLDKCNNFLIALKTAYITLLPDTIQDVIAVGLLAVVVCRVVGR